MGPDIGQAGAAGGRGIAAGLVLLLSAPVVAAAQQAPAPFEAVISGMEYDSADGAVRVDLRFLNPGEQAAMLDLPARIEGRLEQDGQGRAVMLEAEPGQAGSRNIPPGGFARARYRLPSLTGSGARAGTLLSLPRWSSMQVALDPALIKPAGEGSAVQMAAAEPPASPPAKEAVPLPVDPAPGNDFLGNLSAYQPIYAVYAPGTNSDGRLQLSFKYQLFGSRRRDNLPYNWRHGLYFGYTQRMFWDLGAYSMPFRNIDFQPELFYLTPSHTTENGITFGAQIGIRHESNGRDDEASRSVNSLYVAPMAAVALDNGYSLSLAPTLSFLVGSTSDNPGIERYRGKLGLFAELGSDEGWRFTANGRFNVSSGKGAIGLDASYPLPRLWRSSPDFYLFAQSFHGYGENLLDYNRAVTRLRFGIALVR